jgi:GNAT superfamily N-acetyltransferase
MSGISFRRAVTKDAAAIGAVHVLSWRETYAELLPAALIDGLSVAARTAMWQALIAEPAAWGGAAVCVAESDGEIIGFACCGAQRDDRLRELGFGGEFGAVYVLESHQGLGVGRALMHRMARTLAGRGHRAASLWVLRENLAARGFYEKLGGAALMEKVEKQSGIALNEIAYGWDDFAALLR